METTDTDMGTGMEVRKPILKKMYNYKIIWFLNKECTLLKLI